jgi:RND family efflux transporter MFP subunit
MAIVLGPNDVWSVQIGSIEAAIAISGDLRPLEEIAVRARVEGDIVAVLVREGDRVSRGQVLARFDDAVQEGERASATADRESAKADVANAQWNVDQAAELFKAGAIPERDVRAAQQTLAAATARLAAAEARLRSSTRTAEDTRITAPTTGVVSARSVDVGEHVSRGTTLLTVVRNDELELEAAVPARQAVELRRGQPVRFVTGGRQFEGSVARIAPTINPANRTLTVYVRVPNRNGAITGNSFATGRIIGQVVRDALLVPSSALRQSVAGDRPFVYRIANGQVEQVPVAVGIIDDVAGRAQILTGLSAGDQIVIGNVGALGRGMQVRVASADTSRGGARSAAERPASNPGAPGRGSAPARPKADSAAPAQRPRP